MGEFLSGSPVLHYRHIADEIDVSCNWTESYCEAA